jgi:hypothetical protein
MTRPVRLLALVALAGIVSLVAVFGGVAGAVDDKGAKVKVGDDFFDPTSVTIAKGVPRSPSSGSGPTSTT